MLLSFFQPYENIVTLCNDLINNKENERALFYAAESCLINKKTDLGLKFISTISEIEPVCQHYYWPAICQFGKEGNEEGIFILYSNITLNESCNK